MIKKFARILSIILPILISFAFILLAIDTFGGPGATAKHLFIDGRFLWTVILILVLLFTSVKSKILDFSLKVNLIVLVPLCFVYLLFVGIEATHFPNYVLSAYKIHLDGLVYLPLFSLSLFLGKKIKNELPEWSLSKLRDLVLLFFVLLTTYFAVWNLGSVLNTSLNADFYTFLHARSSYDEKMYYRWGDFYEYMIFVKNNTPENVKIVIPPELEPWLARTGDIQLVRTFLFPRILTQYKDKDIPDIKSFSDGTFILISWGDRECNTPDCHGWPKQQIKARKVLYKDPNSDKVIETKENFLYTKDDYKYVYGLIEI